MHDLVEFLDGLPVVGWFCFLTIVGWLNLVGLTFVVRRDATRYLGAALLFTVNVVLAVSLTALLGATLFARHAPAPVPAFHFPPPCETAEPPPAFRPVPRYEAGWHRHPV